MKSKNAYYSSVTGAFVHSYKPIRLYIYDHHSYPYNALNPLVKSLLYNDVRYVNGRYLFILSEEPRDADIFVFPCDLNYFEKREELIAEHLAHFKGNEARHLFFDHRDQAEPYPENTSIRLKASLHREQVSDTLICIPYMETVDNFFWYTRRGREIKYPLSFIGEWSALREAMIAEVSQLVPSAFFRLRDSFYHGGYLKYQATHDPPLPEPDPYIKCSQREEFINVMIQSRFVLALRGYGLNSFRFFEALSLGIPPILVSDHCALPYEHLIDYDRICFRINMLDASPAQRIKEVVSDTSAEKYSEMRQQGRLYYDTYLSTNNFMYLLYDYIQKVI